jgi:hypothetical protein
MGFAMKWSGNLLRSFAAFSEAQGQRYIRSEIAIKWAGLAPSVRTRAPSRQVGAKKTAVGGFECKPTHSAKTQIDGAGCELTGFQMRVITQDHDPVEGQPRFRAIPVNELIDSVTITPLCVC